MNTLSITTAIDAVRTSQKKFVSALVKHESLASALNKIVDVQADYTKQAVDTGFAAGQAFFAALKDKSFYAAYTPTVKGK